MQALVVIPARMGSSRFPGKPLVNVLGMTMIERVWRIACAAPAADRVVIATESEALKQVAEAFGAEVVLTSDSCRTGTDRVAEASAILGDSCEIVCSFQGDALLTPPAVLSQTIEELKREPTLKISTPAIELKGDARRVYIDEKASGSSSGTTVVFSSSRNALYFSKALLPVTRDPGTADVAIFRHIGLYCYRVEVLHQLAALPESRLEAAEKLEQLRALENDIPIRVVVVDTGARTHASIDRPEDVAYVESIIRSEGELL